MRYYKRDIASYNLVIVHSINITDKERTAAITIPGDIDFRKIHIVDLDSLVQLEDSPINLNEFKGDPYV